MNKHRLQRKSKKIHGRGFFSDAITFLRAPGAIGDKARTFVRDKLDEILSKKKKHGAGLKFLTF